MYSGVVYYLKQSLKTNTVDDTWVFIKLSIKFLCRLFDVTLRITENFYFTSKEHIIVCYGGMRMF
jgi:hypothetical protein